MTDEDLQDPRQAYCAHRNALAAIARAGTDPLLQVQQWHPKDC
jgi:hypothetical protein